MRALWLLLLSRLATVLAASSSLILAEGKDHGEAQGGYCKSCGVFCAMSSKRCFNSMGKCGPDSHICENDKLFAAGAVETMASMTEADYVKRNGTRSVLFVLFNRSGSARLRGNVLTLAINALGRAFRARTGRAPRWAARTAMVDELESLALTAPLEACVVVKAWRQHAVLPLVSDWCRRRGAVVFFDVLDNLEMLTRLDALPPSLPLPCGVDVVLTQTEALKTQLGAHRAEVWYHQVTNPGFVATGAQVSRRPCRVGFLAGNAHQFPDEKTLHKIKRGACDAGFQAFAIINQAITYNAGLRSTTRDLLCPKPVASECRRIAPSMPVNLSIVDADQARFHEDKNVLDIDVAIIWPPDLRTSTMNRPPTRLLFWMSHGIPVIVYPYTAYSEIVKKHGYATYGMSMLAKSTAAMGKTLAALAVSPAARLDLKRRGLAIAAEYSTNAVARRLLHIIEVQTAVRKYGFRRAPPETAPKPVP